MGGDVSADLHATQIVEALLEHGAPTDGTIDGLDAATNALIAKVGPLDLGEYAAALQLLAARAPT